MNKTVASVIEDINEWPNPHGGSVFFVTAICTDEDVLSVGRKDHDAALEVQGLLREAIGVEQDFVLEPAKPTKTGRTKWKVLGFGTPGGAATYTAPGSPGGVVAPSAGGAGRTRPPEQFRSPDDFRAEAAVRASIDGIAASGRGIDLASWLTHGAPLADAIYNWMSAKTSEPASSAYGNGSGTVTPAVQAGAGSEDLPQETRPQPADSAGLVDSGDGEAPESTPHIHDYQLRQGVKGFLVCECGKTRKKEVVG